MSSHYSNANIEKRWRVQANVLKVAKQKCLPPPKTLSVGDTSCDQVLEYMYQIYIYIYIFDLTTTQVFCWSIGFLHAKYARTLIDLNLQPKRFVGYSFSNVSNLWWDFNSSLYGFHISGSSSDHLVEAVFPLETWGKQYYSFSTPDRLAL